jgi:hypothetical protein
MTISQSHAIWELCRQGFPLNAEEAAERWESGETYEPDSRLHVSREIVQLIDLCNWEIRVQGSQV